PTQPTEGREGSVAREGQLALLLERAECLGVVGGLSELTLGDVLRLDGHPQPYAVVAQLGDHPLTLQKRTGGTGCCPTGLLAGELEQFVRRDGTTEQAGCDGLGTAHQLARVDQVEGTVGAEPLEEERVTAGVEGGTERGERGTELGVLGDVDHVGGDEEAEPDSEASA